MNPSFPAVEWDVNNASTRVSLPKQSRRDPKRSAPSVIQPKAYISMSLITEHAKALRMSEDFLVAISNSHFDGPTCFETARLSRSLDDDECRT